MVWCKETIAAKSCWTKGPDCCLFFSSLSVCSLLVCFLFSHSCFRIPYRQRQEQGITTAFTEALDEMQYAAVMAVSAHAYKRQKKKHDKVFVLTMHMMCKLSPPPSPPISRALPAPPSSPLSFSTPPPPPCLFGSFVFFLSYASRVISAVTCCYHGSWQHRS